MHDVLDAGIDVVTTVNVQHLESLNDDVEAITGVKQRETVPDHVVRDADQIQLVDLAPEALRRRLAHGNVYRADQIDASLTQYFRVGNLTALRELALLWLADRVDDALATYRHDHRIESPWPARERVVVAVTGGPEGDTLLRRGARIAQRAAGSELLAVHVLATDGLPSAPPARIAEQRQLVESLGGTFHTVVGEDVPSRGRRLRPRGERHDDRGRGVPAQPVARGRPGEQRHRGRPARGDDRRAPGHPRTRPLRSPSAGSTIRAVRCRVGSAGWLLALLGPGAPHRRPAHARCATS